MRLDREQADQDENRHRYDVRREAGPDGGQPSTADSTEIAGVIMLSP